MTTMLVSWHLRWLDDLLLSVALQGHSVSPESLRAVADLLRVCAAGSELMEQRLAGIESYSEGGNVISLKPHLLKKRYVIRRVVDQDQPL